MSTEDHRDRVSVSSKIRDKGGLVVASATSAFPNACMSFCLEMSAHSDRAVRKAVTGPNVNEWERVTSRAHSANTTLLKPAMARFVTVRRN